MNGNVSSPLHAAGSALPRPALDPELGRRLFGSLQRAEQRRKAEQYVRGLLEQPGRKTLRNIARQFDGNAAQQNVHHFISASPWDWMPVRHALARHVQHALVPEAWVVRPTVIPKVGPHSIGVDPQGPNLYGQQAVGVWMAASQYAVPVDWRLRLSGRWLEDPLRERANIPSDATSGTLEECVREAVAGVEGIEGVLGGPVVIDAEEIDGPALAGRLASRGTRFLVRVPADAPLRLNRAKLPRFGDRDRTAAELAASLPRLRRRVNPGDGPTTAAAIPVTHPEARRQGLLLVGEWRDGPADPSLWLTNADAPALSSLLRLTRLPAVVARDFTTISANVGVTDFAGRSFPGWHRHVTLASVAHHVVAMHTHSVVGSSEPDSPDYRPVI
ncbi:transposase [Streptomyces sp. NPDC046332]|uniref:IS701 family transposase n=1 Tax=Streptomyces sp. NPDC046332 TaxID=3155133 RepID=UPI0033C758CA